MPDFLTMTCPSCGGRLQITPDVDRFACAHCGNEHIVNRSGGIVTIEPIVERLAGIGAATDKTASELAIRRISEELPQLEARKRELEDSLVVFAQRELTVQKEHESVHSKRKLGVVMVTFAVASLLLIAGFAIARTFLPSESREGLTCLLTLSGVALVVCGLMSVLLYDTAAKASKATIDEGAKASHAIAQAEYESVVTAIKEAQTDLARHRQIVSSQ